MVRRLPWEQAADNGSAPPPPSTPARPRRPKPILDSSDLEQSPQKASRTHSARASASASRATPIPEHGSPHSRATSAPLGPPKEEFMLDGWGKDDRYRMVEDEFLNIAKEFTQHLHAAEYLRLKAAARNKSAGTITEISRPVVGSMPDATRRKLESVERAKRQADAVAKMKREKPKDYAVSDEEAPEPWLGTALHGLMEEPTKKVTTITDVVETNVPTKAAGGYKGSKVGRMPTYGFGSDSDDTDEAPMKVPGQKERDVPTESEEDDDLDGPPSAQQAITSWKRKLVVSPTKSRIKRQPAPTIKGELDLPPAPPGKSAMPASTSTSTPTSSHNCTPPIKTEDESVVELPRTSADILARMAKRRELARRKREREEEDKKMQEAEEKRRRGMDVIPTFL